MTTSSQNWAPTNGSAVGTKLYDEEIKHFQLYSIVETFVHGKYYSENVCMSSGKSQCGRINILGVEKAQPRMNFISNGYLGLGIG